MNQRKENSWQSDMYTVMEKRHKDQQMELEVVAGWLQPMVKLPLFALFETWAF